MTSRLSLFQDEDIIDSLQDQLLAKDEIIYNICTKFLKLKTSKSALQKKIRRLKTETREVDTSLLMHCDQLTTDYIRS